MNNRIIAILIAAIAFFSAFTDASESSKNFIAAVREVDPSAKVEGYLDLCVKEHFLITNNKLDIKVSEFEKYTVEKVGELCPLTSKTPETLRLARETAGIFNWLFDALYIIIILVIVVVILSCVGCCCMAAKGAQAIVEYGSEQA